MTLPAARPFGRALVCLLVASAAASAQVGQAFQPAVADKNVCPTAADETGEQIFKANCAKCHGEQGQGVEDQYPDPLAGELPLAELAALIDKTMPEGEPEKIDAQQAKKVAAYIYDAFYSPIAQARNQPARIELSRLTVRQYQNTVIDLVGSFRSASETSAERGLKAEYSSRVGRRRRSESGDSGATRRIDPQVHFDFGEESPIPDKLEHHRFSIRWSGSVLAPETGDYELIVRTEHATRLFVNDTEQPLIDRMVKSGDDTEYRASIFLVGGRDYPLVLEFSKGKAGVDDSKKQKAPPPKVKASVALLWKLPGREIEVVPRRHLSPQPASERFVLTTKFPPDDRSVGYERGTSVSKEWDTAATDAAIESANYVAEHLRELAGASPDDENASERLREFAGKFVERAFRRPLDSEQRQVFVERQFAAAPDPATGINRVVLLALKSPRFLYREPGVGGDAYDTASRLSFTLWDSLPDETLLEAAAKDELKTREQVAEQARRMLGDSRAKSKVREFLIQWLQVDRVADLSKDKAVYPEFTPQVVSDLRTSLDLLLDEVVWSESSDFRELLLSDALYLNGPLAKLYGTEVAVDAAFEKVRLDAEHRAGLLTHPYLLAAFAYNQTSSPIHRGVFVSRSLLGRPLRPPPDAFTPLAPELHPDLTTRERVALQTNSKNCQSCHAMINPLGFAFENFDAIGRFRSEEKGKPINARGKYLTKTGDPIKFRNVRELAQFLSGSDEVHSAFTQQLFHYLVKQPVRAYGPQQAAELRKSFAQNNFSIRQLIAEIAVTAALASPEKIAQNQ
jgi:mono/diheme cytochrome c family protein